MKTTRSVLGASSLALVLLLSGCAGKELTADPVLAEEPNAEPSRAGAVAIDVLKGAGQGALVTVYCLPFGIVACAVIGGISKAAPIEQSAALP